MEKTIKAGDRVRVLTPTMAHSASRKAKQGEVGVVESVDFGPVYYVKGDGWSGEASKVERVTD